MMIERSGFLESKDAKVLIDLSPFIAPEKLQLFVDPATAAAVAKAAIEYYQSRATDEWQRSVGDKLKLIIEKLDQVVAKIEEAVFKIIENDNSNWRSFYSANIRGPGATWEAMANSGEKLAAEDKRYIVNSFSQLSSAVQTLTDSSEYRSWGFILAPVVRSAFPYTLLALKLTKGELTELTAKAAVVEPILRYLRRSLAEGEVEPLSFSNFLRKRNSELAGLIASMDAWCNGWVRVSDEYYRPGGGREHDRPPIRLVRVGRITGGALAPVLGETAVVTDNDSRFRAAYYPDYPGSIGSHEEEKARHYCSTRIAGYSGQRDALARSVSALTVLIADIREEIELIEKWVAK